MKNRSKYLSAVLLLLATACSQTQEGAYYTPNGADAKEIHFIQSSIEKEFSQDTQTGVIEVEIARTGDKGSYEVVLANKGDNSSLFKVPETVTIPDGSHSVTIPVEVDMASGTAGSTFKTTIYIASRESDIESGSAQISQYVDKVNLSASFILEWEPFYRTNAAGEEVQQLATYHYNLFYTGRDSGLEVEKAVGTNIYRLKDWASGVTFRFILNEDNTCTVPAQTIGYFNSNYNEYVFVADMAVYTGDDSAYASYPCTFDGKDTFSFYLIYYVSAGYFAMGEETLVFDSDPDTTPVVDIAFDGIQTTTTGFKAPQLSFTPNEYTKFFQAAVVAGDLTGNVLQQEQLRQQLIAGEAQTVTPVVTLYEADQSIWNVPKGNYTAVALAYDEDENPRDLYTLRFTCDPNEEYAPRVLEFEFTEPSATSGYSPYNTIAWRMKTSGVASARYLCMNAAYADYYVENTGISLEELAAMQGNVLNEDAIALLNSETGMSTVFSSLDEGTDFILAVLLSNSFGDTTFVMKNASTKGYFAEDFDRTKEMNDFLGAFLATANVSAGSNSSEADYRVDITRLNERDVLITGMSNMRDYAPEIRGYYDSDLHMIIVEPQSAGMYGSNYAVLGFSDGLSLYWGGNSMAIGYIGDELHWAASPYATEKVNSYLFLLFSSPEANSSTYLREYVGSRTYGAVSMVPLQMAPQSASADALSSARRTVEIDGYRFDTFLADFSSQPSVVAPVRAVSSRVSELAGEPQGKRLRTDLTLHTR
ncbi:MAG TPA: hypothetical protein H9828_00190 [Candidatus Alistipes intestinigallinarum]|uniref:Uncharacterized protein n=1 Tax=Candidatus Alistipes intestinigallinarum TaxID=2838440 RepID=A0A9D2CBE7_9BACT|nr:hypothetical protein [Candidatus Alistipes intestinigallinarum]